MQNRYHLHNLSKASPLLLNNACAYLLFFGFLLLGLIAHWGFSSDLYHDVRSLSHTDASNYIQMAESTFAPVKNPFALRPFTPLLVHVLKKNSQHLLGWSSAWITVTFLSLFLSSIYLFRILRDHAKIGIAISCVWVLFLTNNFCYTLFHFQNPFIVDPINNLIWSAALYYLLGEHYKRFCILIIVGFINKEVALFLLPLYPLLVLNKVGTIFSKDFGRSVIRVSGVFLLYIAFRIAFARMLDPEGYQLFTAGTRSISETLAFSLNHQKGLKYIYGVFHQLWLIFPCSLYVLSQKQGRRNPWIIISCYFMVALLFGRLFATDANRVFVMAMPVIVAVSAQLFTTNNPEKNFGTVTLLLFAYSVRQWGWVTPSDGILLDALVVCFLVLPQFKEWETPPPLLESTNTPKNMV